MTQQLDREVRSDRGVWVSVVGSILATVLAVAISVSIRALGIAADETWREFPPPLEPFLLPAPAAAVSGLILTTRLTRPKRLTARRVLSVSLAVLLLMTCWFAVFAIAQTVATNVVADPEEQLWRIFQAVLALPVLFASWLLIPGILALVVLFPAVGAFGCLMRSIVRRRVSSEI